MGTIRFLKYDVSPLEYGIHLNFYFMLAIHELCHGIYRRIVDQFYLFDTVIGALVLSAYYKLTRFPFLEEYQRTTWLRQNIEGIYSIVPFFAFYLIVADFGRYYEKRRFKGLIIYVNTAIVMLIYAYMRITAEHKQISKKELLNLLHETRNNLVSRRSTNVFYVLWSLVISYVSFATSYTVCRLSPHSVHLNTMVTFVSRNMLIVFLAGNIGIIVSKSTGLCPHPLAANIIYLFSIFMLLGWIRTRIIRR
ncbi:hypothetical protein ECANGB1_1010 [Enterospora canceri]|uniref:GPI-anchored wall transfer protein 1 n=1 Tax=Enterospora canceri TaxID=1081671 RepID=A0A1Y1S598_9MICR|nr:hypothetical protein ECANGB1_1010 [Enterospora canceri]